MKHKIKVILVILFLLVILSIVVAQQIDYSFPNDDWIDRVLSLNQSGYNFTADYFKGNGSLLTSVALTAHALNGTDHTGNLSTNRIVKDTGTNFVGWLLDVILDFLSDRDDAINTTTNIEGLINDTIDSKVVGANGSMKIYVDAQDVIYNESMVTHDASTNASMKIYVDDKIINLNDSVKLWVYNGSFYLTTEIDEYIASNITGLNESVKLWVYNGSFYLVTEIDSHIANNITALNESVKVWVYNGTFYTKVEVNETIDSKLAVTYYNATSINVNIGTDNTNDITQLQNYDGLTYNISEATGSPAMDVRINFTGIVDFNQLVVRMRTTDGGSHRYKIQIWDYTESIWEDYTNFVEVDTFKVMDLGVYDPDEHLSSGLVQVRIYLDTTGIPTHEVFLDWVVLSDGPATFTTNEVDPLSHHRGKNINSEGYNATFDIISANDWTNATLTSSQITDFNETANATIDARVTQSWLQNLLDAIYASITYVDERVDSIDNHTATIDTNTQRKGDDIYLYNDSTTMFLNETKLNLTIDERVSVAGGGDITEVNTQDIYISGGETTGAVSLVFNETKLNMTTNASIDARVGAGDGNFTVTLGKIFLAFVDLAELDNSNSAFITIAVSTLTNYPLTSYVISMINGNRTESESALRDNIDTNSTFDRAYTDTRVESIDNTSSTTIIDWIDKNSTYDRGYTDTRVDSIDNHTATVDSNASTACSGTTTYLDGEGTCDDISGVYVQASDWTTIDNYPTGCTNQFVVTIDDTLTCASVDSADIGTVLLSDLANDINTITNTSDGKLGLLNVTTNLTIHASNIWYNGSGICIGNC